MSLYIGSVTDLSLEAELGRVWRPSWAEFGGRVGPSLEAELGRQCGVVRPS